MPRIAYVMSRFPKLTETFVLFEILSLERMGFQIEVFPLLRHQQSVVHPEALSVVSRAHYHPFCSWPIVKANWHYFRRNPLRYLKTFIGAVGGTLGSLNFVAGAVGIFPKVVRFAYEMERAGIQHVHAHFANHPALAAWIIQELCGIPYSFTAHGSDLHVDQTMLERKVQSARFVVTVSEYNRRFIQERVTSDLSGKIHVIHCGIDPDVFRPMPRQPRVGFQIVSVGSLEEVKGHRYLIEACRLLAKRDLNFRCDIVGEGKLRAELLRQVEAGGLSSQVRLLGGLNRADVTALLQQADALVLASVPTREGKREGIPVALMEGMAAGLPVISTSISGIPELVGHERDGLLVPPGDSAALAAALERLIRNRSWCEALGAAARRKVIREFNLAENTRRLGALFMESLRTNPPYAVEPLSTLSVRESSGGWAAGAATSSGGSLICD